MISLSHTPIYLTQVAVSLLSLRLIQSTKLGVADIPAAVSESAIFLQSMMGLAQILSVPTSFAIAVKQPIIWQRVPVIPG